MGIPSYFSYIIKNYSNIIRNRESLNEKLFQFLFMDCNSIIYDALRVIEKEHPDLLNNHKQLETKLILLVVSQIKDYIYYIKPSEMVYIAFDGVAPFAKMEQQRIRRHKNSNSSSAWNTSQITPGTKFMTKLSKSIETSFRNLESYFHVKQIIVSSSSQEGEGEHKMFQYIRNNLLSSTSKNCAVYGLDSDLIMLSLFHCKYFDNIYIFRETPAFGKQFFPQTTENDNNCHFLDIKLLANGIMQEMKCKHLTQQRIYDYVFLCFFLGNDFLPHFPSLNIRTNGIDTLLSSYAKLFGQQDKYLIDRSLTICWKHVYSLIYDLAKYEHERFSGEMKTREKWGKREWKMDSDEERDFLVQSVPVLYRVEENYIDPSQRYWQNRYYKCLFGGETDRKSICINYLEGLEWVFKYYTSNCPHWRWKYHYSYPPLLRDLLNFIPKYDFTFIHSSEKSNKPFTSDMQLCYVLPKQQHNLLSPKYKQLFEEKYQEYFIETFDYHWAFCRYLWEAHPILPAIPYSILEKWETC